MRAKRVIISVMVCVAVLEAVVWAVGSRSSSSSPVGRGVVPPSSVRSGLIRSPNPINMTSDLIVTGNIAGDKHFRGVVPYNSFSSFSGITGTESIDSFLRYSGGGEMYGQYSGNPVPYYSRSRTVTYSSPGVGVVGPETTYGDYREEAARLSASQQSRAVTPQTPMFVKPSAASELSKMIPDGNSADVYVAGRDGKTYFLGKSDCISRQSSSSNSSVRPRSSNSKRLLSKQATRSLKWNANWSIRAISFSSQRRSRDLRRAFRNRRSGLIFSRWPNRQIRRLRRHRNCNRKFYCQSSRISMNK